MHSKVVSKLIDKTHKSIKFSDTDDCIRLYNIHSPWIFTLEPPLRLDPGHASGKKDEEVVPHAPGG